MTTIEKDRIAKALGSAIKLRRGELGWKREKLAVESDVSHGVVQSIEQGRTLPQLGTLLKIAKALGLSAEELVGLATRTSHKRAA